jgi:DNA topoisomerase-1
MGTILDRGYVFKKGTALVPSFLAFAVSPARTALRPAGRLRVHRADGGRSTRSPAARPSGCPGCAGSTSAPRHGRRRRSDDPGLKSLVSDISDIDARDVSSFPLAGTDIVVRVGRYGPYLERDGQRVNVPEDLAPDELTGKGGRAALSQPNDDKVLGTDPAPA